MSELRVVIYTAGEKVSAKQIVLLADVACIHCTACNSNEGLRAELPAKIEEY